MALGALRARVRVRVRVRVALGAAIFALATLTMAALNYGGTYYGGTYYGGTYQVRLETLPGFPAWERDAFDAFHTHFSKVWPASPRFTAGCLPPATFLPPMLAT